MEKQMTVRNAAARNFFFKLLMVWLLVINAFSALQAQDTIFKLHTPEVKYVGIVDEKFVFQVDFQNEPTDAFTLEIKDDHGYQLYFEKFTNKKFKKQFAINKSDLEDNTITFVITSQNGVQKQVFDINMSSRMINDVNVIKL
jgi:hypothetical protein